MTDTEFQDLVQIQDTCAAKLAGAQADLAYWRNRCERAEYSRQSLEYQVAKLTQQIEGMKRDLLPKLDKGADVVRGVYWPYAEVTVDVEIGYDQPNSIWLRGVEISSVVDTYQNHLLSRLNELACEQRDKAAREDAEEARINAWIDRRAA